MKTVKELKKQVSKKDKMNLLLFSLICFITLTFTMGYSLLNQSLKISGKTNYRVIANMRITNLSEPTRVDGGDIKYNGTYSVNSVSLHVELPEKNSTVSYEVEMTNIGNINQWIKSITATSDNDNITYKIEGLIAQEDIIYSPVISDNNIKTFTITFYYKDSITDDNFSKIEKTSSTIISFEYETLETYLITYNLDGGSVTSNPVNYTKADTITLNTPTKKGYEFLGWTGSNGDVPQTTVTIGRLSEGDRNYIANWQIKRYVLTINPNGGTYDGSADTVTSDIIYNNSITISVPTRTGYIFNGWTLSNNDSTLNGTTFTMGEGDTTLTANWTPITYTVTYNCNGGAGSMSSSSHTYDVSKTLTSSKCYKVTAGTSGAVYKIAGWSTSSTAATAEYSDGQSINNLTQTDGTTINLYAVWSSTPMFTYNGSYNVLNDGNGNWRVKFLGGGTYTSNVTTTIDVFLVGGGGGGGVYPLGASGGGGGGSGYTQTYKAISLSATNYSITIGAGGGSNSNGGSTSAFGKSVSGGNPGNVMAGGAGGSGGGAGANGYGKSGVYGGQYGNDGTDAGDDGGSGQGRTTCEFGEGTISGCNSGVTNYASGGSGGSSKISSSLFSGYASSMPGISAGAGSGGSAGTGGSAANNTGSGGGGGAGVSWNGGSGGSGIVVIRNPR